METMSMKEFCDKLREAAKKAIVDGSVPLPLMFIMTKLDPDDARKVTAGYIRTTVNRVPEVKEAGSISVRKRTNEDGVEYYDLVFVNGVSSRKTVYNKDQVMQAKQKAVNKVVEMLLQLNPNVTDLEGDELAGAMKVIKRYQDLIRTFAQWDD